MRSLALAGTLIIFCFGFSHETFAQELSPAQEIFLIGGKMRVALFEPYFQKPDRQRDRREFVRQSLEGLCDMKAIGKRILKNYYPTNPALEEKFVSLLSRYLASTLVAVGGSLEDFKVLNVSELSSDRKMIVTMRIVTKFDSSEARVYLWMSDTPQGRRAYWLAAEGFDFLQNISVQFNRIMKTSGSIEVLMKTMKEHTLVN